MKTVLIVDATPMLQEFITEKLSAENVMTIAKNEEGY